MYKIKHNLSESCLKDLCSAVNSNYNLPSQSYFRIQGVFFLNVGFNTVFWAGNVEHSSNLFKKKFLFLFIQNPNTVMETRGSSYY